MKSVLIFAICILVVSSIVAGQGFVIQSWCYDSACTNCYVNNKFPISKCLGRWNATGSLMFRDCGSDVVTRVWGTATCSGTSSRQIQPVDTCFYCGGGQYCLNACSSTASTHDAVSAHARSVQ